MIIQLSKIETTQVAGGTPNVNGLCISVHSATDEFNFIKTANLDTATLSAEDATTVLSFMALVDAALL